MNTRFEAWYLFTWKLQWPITATVITKRNTFKNETLINEKKFCSHVKKVCFQLKQFPYIEKEFAHTEKRFVYIHKTNPWQILTVNSCGKFPWQKATANSCGKSPRQIATANSHGLFPGQIIIVNICEGVPILLTHIIIKISCFSLR